MESIDVLARLYTLNGNPGDLSEDDRAFVIETVKMYESEGNLNRHQVLRIVRIPVPGEPVDQSSRFWTLDMVNVVWAAPEQVIWRYMPLEQLFFTLSKKALHFSPLSVMKDASEGQLPGSAWDNTKEELQTNPAGAMDADTILAQMVAQRRQDACINCWYLGDSDSLDMWQEYAPSNGVAIQTTVRGLVCALQVACMQVTLAPTSYLGVDQQRKFENEAFYGSLFNKHKEGFSHENELRALVYRVNSGTGVDVSTALDTLIQRLVLSPQLPDWAVPSMVQAIRQFGLNGPIEKSQLKPAP